MGEKPANFGLKSESVIQPLSRNGTEFRKSKNQMNIGRVSGNSFILRLLVEVALSGDFRVGTATVSRGVQNGHDEYLWLM